MSNQPTEEWRLVPSLDGKYAVSNLGRVRREVRGRGGRFGQISGHTSNTGYRVIKTGPKTARIRRQIHRLVAEVFLGPSELQVNHIDGDKQNNVPSNLEYVTDSEQIRHAYRLGLRDRRKQRANFAKLTEDQVRFIKSSDASAQELADRFNVKRNAIWYIRRGDTWSEV